MTAGGATLKGLPGELSTFPPPPAVVFPIGISKGRTHGNAAFALEATLSGPDPLIRDGSEKEGVFADVSGLRIWEMGEALLGGLHGVLKLCSQTTDGEVGHTVKGHDTFPLPTSRNLLSSFAKPKTVRKKAMDIIFHLLRRCRPGSSVAC